MIERNREILKRWRAGHSIHAIAREMNMNAKRVDAIIARLWEVKEGR